MLIKIRNKFAMLKDYTKIADAILFSFEAHKNANRKGSNIPYVIHPLRVYASLWEAGVSDAAVLLAALLHDTVEDAGVELSQIASRFGEDVAKMVDMLTDDKTLNRAERKQAARERLRQAPARVKLIKLADRLDNILDMHKSDWNTAKKLEYINESELLIKSLTSNLDDDKFNSFIEIFLGLLEQNIKSVKTDLLDERE